MRVTSSIFASLLVILFATGQTSAQLEVTFAVVDTIIAWGSTFFSLGDSFADGTGKSLHKILTKVDEISNELKHFETQMDIKLDIMLSTLLNDFELTVELQGLKTELLHHLDSVDGFHDESLKYSRVESYANETLQGFVETVLYGVDNLSRTLVRMHKIFSPGSHAHLNPGFLSLIIKKSQQNLPTDCQRSITPHQLMYYIYAQLITAEMKALAAHKKVYTIKSWLENSKFDYKTELEEAFTSFEKGVLEYHQIFIKQLALLPRHLRRCHVHPPTRGVDFVELERLSRAKLITPDNVEQRQCKCCLSPEPFYTENGIIMKVHNCKSLNRDVNACPVENGLLNEYSWWEDYEGTYGGNKTCSKPKNLFAGIREASGAPLFNYVPMKHCNNWYCTVEETIKEGDDNLSWRISSKPQVSDIWNDMVVTGVQFIVKDRTIHLQIQQGKFSDNGLVYNNIAWKDVDTYYNASELYASSSADERLGADQKSIRLDDITVPANSVVTGVQFMRYPAAPYFGLYVHATIFDLATGKLKPSENFWCNRSICYETGFRTSNLTRRSIEIDMGAADNPTKGYGFDYDPEPNKVITFTHTDVHKDVGQTTIPFIDLQPVQVQPAFPLSGVGLYYRGKEGFGGYIAPRIFTLDVTQRMTTEDTQ